MLGASEMVKDIGKLGYDEIILKPDNEPALRSAQAEVKKMREHSTILENTVERMEQQSVQFKLWQNTFV